MTQDAGVTMTADHTDPGRLPVKLRIQDNSLRFRLTQTEVIRLKENGRVDAEVRFSADRALCYFVASTQSLEDIAVEYTADCVRVFLPSPWVLAWADSDPKLIPAIVIGILSSIGFFANRAPSTTFVPQRSLYPSSG